MRFACKIHGIRVYWSQSRQTTKEVVRRGAGDLEKRCKKLEYVFYGISDTTLTAQHHHKPINSSLKHFIHSIRPPVVLFNRCGHELRATFATFYSSLRARWPHKKEFAIANDNIPQSIECIIFRIICHWHQIEWCRIVSTARSARRRACEKMCILACDMRWGAGGIWDFEENVAGVLTKNCCRWVDKNATNYKGTLQRWQYWYGQKTARTQWMQWKNCGFCHVLYVLASFFQFLRGKYHVRVHLSLGLAVFVCVWGR